jgi:hypothetical protein
MVQVKQLKKERISAMGKKIMFKGNEVWVYNLSNKELIDYVEDENNSAEDREIANERIRELFRLTLVPRNGETYDDVFARFFGEFVNGRCGSVEHVSKAMCREHRYLQGQMFKVCVAYIKELAKAYKDGRYDARNEFACEEASLMAEAYEHRV